MKVVKKLYRGNSSMAFKFDPEIEAVVVEMAKQLSEVEAPERGDWKTLREQTHATLEQMSALAPALPDVQTQSFNLKLDDGDTIELRWYTKDGANPGSAVVYAHGGGMVCGSVDYYDSVVSEYVQLSGVPFLSVGYRLAPEKTGTSPMEDTYAALVWLKENAAELGVDTDRIAVMGDSAGGGIAAGTAILARDRGTEIAKQILIYPMLDDTNLKPDDHITSFLSWTYDNNYTGWKTLLGDDFETDNISPVAAPARNTNFEGLAPAYIDVGELDIFRDKDVNYALKLWEAGVSVELHVHPGAQHGFERFAPQSDVAKRTSADRIRSIQSV